MPELRGLNEKKKYEVEVNSKFIAFYNNKGALGKCILRLQKNIVKITASYLWVVSQRINVSNNGMLIIILDNSMIKEGKIFKTKEFR